MGIQHRVWLTGLALALVLPGCGGTVTSGSGQAAGNRGHAPPPASEDEAPASPSPPAGNSGGAPGSAMDGGVAGTPGPPSVTSDAGPGDCTATLAQVSSAFGITCPALLCDGTVWASTCNALPASVVQTAESSCGSTQILSIVISPALRQDCYYSFGSGQLLGAAAWDDTHSFCGTSATIHAGLQPGNCTPVPVATLCDASNPLNNTSGPPRTCRNAFSGTCEPCCEASPEASPDFCADKPDGYPGYQCTPTPGSYCACTCGNSKWQCAC